MFTSESYKIICNNKYLAIENDDIKTNAKIVLRYNPGNTSDWKLLQNISNENVLLYNVSSCNVITLHNNYLVTSSLFLKNVTTSHCTSNSLKNINISNSDIWYPKTNKNINPKIAFWNRSDENIRIKYTNSNDLEIYLTTDGKEELYVDFVLNNTYVDYPGNCNIEQLTTKNKNCRYFNVETGGKYCFRQSIDKYFLSTFGTNKVFDAENAIAQKYVDGTKIISYNRHGDPNQLWYIWKDNFNRTIIQISDKLTFLDVSGGNLNTQAHLWDTSSNINRNCLFTFKKSPTPLLTIAYYIFMINYDNNGKLQAINHDNGAGVFLKTDNNYNFIYSTNNNKISYNNINYLEIGYKNFDLVPITQTLQIIESQLNIQNSIHIMNDVTKKINDNIATINKESVNKNDITSNYFNKVKLLHNINFKLTNYNLLDIIYLFKNNNINFTENSTIIYWLYKLADISVNNDVNTKNSIFVDTDPYKTNIKLSSLGWDRTIPLNNGEIDTSFYQNTLNRIFTKLNIFINHLLDNTLYGEKNDLINDFMNIFVYENKLCNYSIVTGILAKLMVLINPKFSIDNIIPTLNDYSKQQGIAYWSNGSGYWSDTDNEINWSVIESTDVYSHWKDRSKNDPTLISTNNFDNVFRIYSDVTKTYNIKSNENNNRNTLDSLNYFNKILTHTNNNREFELDNTNYYTSGIKIDLPKVTDDNLVIGKRYKGQHKTFNDPGCTSYNAIIFVTEKSRIQHTNSGTHRARMDGSCKQFKTKDWYDMKSNDSWQTKTMRSTRDWPSKVVMYIYNPNNTNEYYGPIEFDDYHITYDTRFVGYDSDYHDNSCDGNEKNKEMPGTGGGLSTSWDTRKIGNPSYYKHAGYTVDFNGKIFIVQKTLADTLTNNVTDLNYLRTNDNAYNTEVTGERVHYYDKNWIKDYDKNFMTDIYSNDNNGEKNWNGIRYYGSAKIINGAFCLKDNYYTYKYGTYYTGNVFNENQTIPDDISQCTQQINILSLNDKTTQNCRCFVIPNKKEIRVFDDRFDFALLYWLDKNKQQLTDKLSFELLNLFKNQPELLLSYRIYKKYIGCQFEEYTNFENFLGPPMLYVPKNSNLTEYTCYYADSVLDNNKKHVIKLTNELNSTFYITDKNNKITSFLDKLYHSFITINKTQSFVGSAKIYYSLSLKLEFNDLFNYITDEYKSNITLTKSSLEQIEPYSLIITNDDSLKNNATEYIHCGTYDTPYINKTQTNFEYKTIGINIFFKNKLKKNASDNTGNKLQINFSNNETTPYISIVSMLNLEFAKDKGCLSIRVHNKKKWD
jgi:hypothetical protein